MTGAYQATIRAALARWALVSNLTFVQLTDSPAVDIRIGWAKVSGIEIGETVFSYPDQTGQPLAFYPGTVLKLEDPAATPLGTGLGDIYQGTAATLYQITLHELGHALGLAHSTNPADVMFPALGPADTDLSPADIAGIQFLYGSPGSPPKVQVTTAPNSVPSTVATPAVTTIPVYRFFDTRSGTQLLTSSAAEHDTIVATRPDLVDEGIAMGGTSTDDPNAVPVFRFFDTGTGTHFFTASASEKAALGLTRPGLVPERTNLYEHATAQPGDVPVFRFFQQADGTHFYTGSAVERVAILATRPDMIYEGIAFYAPKAS
ncbi:MAG: matrixin family metalloprotease [Alphaproteobacteria bacterium]|nr:MAG: matrixin family metalloprotease [Alphaproteobacteria bacterium]